jgi:DNA-binding MarR family transcriptional regulator
MKKQRDVHDLAQEIDGNLREIQRALRKPLSTVIARGELTAPQRAIMAILVRSDGLSLKELSKQASLAHSTVSGIVDRLEKRGMVGRKADDSDGRFSRIVVTDVIRDFVRDKLPELAIQPLLKALERAGPAQRKKIVEGLRILRSALDEE